MNISSIQLATMISFYNAKAQHLHFLLKNTSMMIQTYEDLFSQPKKKHMRTFFLNQKKHEDLHFRFVGAKNWIAWYGVAFGSLL
jgi:hypothetical protein